MSLYLSWRRGREKNNKIYGSLTLFACLFNNTKILQEFKFERGDD